MNLAPASVLHRQVTGTPVPFVVITLSLAVASAMLSGFFPLGFSIVTVFLFAGPHNWIEARYFLGRMPPRWGKLWPYFTFAFVGLLSLTLAYTLLAWVDWGWTEVSQWQIALSLWNSLLVIWILALVRMRSRQNPLRDWQWTMPVGLMIIALAWMHPEGWSLGLVFLHPLISFWILDRELRRIRSPWQHAYRWCLLAVPVLLVLLWWHLADAPSLPGEDAFTSRITRHAGADILPRISSHLLVATHTFLEMLHYSVWLVAIPLMSWQSAPWKLNGVPLARRSTNWMLAVGMILILGAAICISLWCGFLADYPATRDLYFTVAMLHVLAEVPFLLRML